MELRIRRAVVSDMPAILRYDTHIAPERLMGRLHDGFVFAVLSEDRLIGTFRYGLLWQEHPFLELIFLDAACRSKGIGRACMAWWEAEMRHLGFRFALTSTVEDETARFFYEKLGYERCGSFFPPEQTCAELLYRKTLSAEQTKKGR